MAEAVDVGGIVVRLIADAKQLEKTLKESGANLKKFGSDAEQSSKKTESSVNTSLRNIQSRIVGLAAAYLSVGAAVRAFNNDISTTTQLDNLSQTTGIAIESLSQLRGVLLQLGIDFDAFRQVLTQFAPRMSEALQSPTSRGAQALKALGIEVRDAAGNLRSFDELLPEFADSFSKYTDGLNKAALASAIFGEEAGPRMIPLLNRGRAGLEELRKEVARTITPEDARRVEDYRVAVAKLQLAFEEFFRGIVRTAGPVLTEILAKLTRAMQDMQLPQTFREELNRTNDTIRQTEEAIAKAEERLKSLIFDWDQERLKTPFGLNEWLFPSETAEQLTERLRAMRSELDQLIERRNILQQRTIGEFQTTVTRGEGQAPKLDPFAMERSQVELEKLQERLMGTRDIFDEVNYSWQAHGELVQRTLQQIDRTYEQKHKRDQARYRIERQLRLSEQQQMLDTASVAAQTITALWPKQKGAAIASAVINTAVGVTRAFASLNPPWSFATAALIAAAGAAQIASIRSTSETGGSSAAPSVSAPTAEAPAAQQASPSRALFISGLDPNAIFSGKQLEELIRAISNEVQNGVTLISTRNLPI